MYANFDAESHEVVLDYLDTLKIITIISSCTWSFVVSLKNSSDVGLESVNSYNKQLVTFSILHLVQCSDKRSIIEIALNFDLLTNN